MCKSIKDKGDNLEWESDYHNTQSSSVVNQPLNRSTSINIKWSVLEILAESFVIVFPDWHVYFIIKCYCHDSEQHISYRLAAVRVLLLMQVHVLGHNTNVMIAYFMPLYVLCRTQKETSMDDTLSEIIINIALYNSNKTTNMINKI